MQLANSRRAVVTGLGCVTPVGRNVQDFWRALMEGRNAAARVESFDTSPFRTHVGCEVRGFEAPAVTRSAGAGYDRATALALAAARDALGMAGLDDPGSEALELAALSIGTTMGETNFLDKLRAPTAANGGTRPAPPWREVLTHSASSITEILARELGIGGPKVSLPAACSAGNYAIGFALDLIRQGEVDVALAGGAEAFSESAFAGFSRLGALSPDLCRPFDLKRQGLLVGEGAGMLLLESEERARGRGAVVLAEVLGYGLSCDAYHITGPHPDGAGAQACMETALKDARVGRDAVGYISCHGTGTRHNDAIESKAIRSTFGAGARSIPASSIKALTGHLMGAASAVEAISCVLALREGVLPPTWNLEEQDPECDLDVIPNQPREKKVRVAINNSYAFGGNNACVAFGSI
jgi:3-oxoacyl-[acyl-carrier-protein] synthase II